MAFTGKVALITGGTKGIGLAIADLYIERGASVAVVYSSDESAAAAFTAKYPKDKTLAIKADAGSVPEIERFIAETVARFGKIDYVIASAGVMPMKTLEATTEEDFDATHRLNVKGSYFLAQKATPHMNEGGSIIFFSSNTTVITQTAPAYFLYNSTKGAIEKMTFLGAKGLASKGIRLNCVAPGPTGTDLFYKGKPDALVDTIKAFSPFNRLGTPQEIAQVVAWLTGPESAWVDGQIIRANGAAAFSS